MDTRSPSTAAGSPDKAETMITTELKNFARYKGLCHNLDLAIDWLLAGGWEKLPEGKHEIAGENVFALVQRYDTKPHANCRFEAHRLYVDIQMVVAGKELMEVRPAEGLQITEPYKPDIEFYATPEPGSANAILMRPGMAAVLFPEDVHRPCMALGGKSEAVQKIVIKVAL